MNVKPLQNKFKGQKKNSKEQDYDKYSQETE